MAYTYQYPRPAVTVDAVVYNLEKGNLYILMIKRKQDPYAKYWALPGGFMDMGETPEAAVERELKEETGIQSSAFVQVKAFGAVDRDPRHRTISIAFLSLLKGALPKVEGTDDAEDASWFNVNDLPVELAFDHAEIINASKKLLKNIVKGDSANILTEWNVAADEGREVLEILGR